MEWSNLTNIKLHLKTLENNAQQIGTAPIMPEQQHRFKYACELMIRDQVELLGRELDKIKKEIDERTYEYCKGFLKTIKNQYEKATKNQPPQLPEAAIILERLRSIKEWLHIRD